MKRRELFKAMTAMITLGAAGHGGAEQPKYGCMTVDGHRAHREITGENLHVYLDGMEVQGCYEADDIDGYALVWCQDSDQHRDWTKRGSRHIAADRGGACRMRLTGNITMRPGK